MSMDGLSMYASCTELAPLIGGKVDKVQQPERDSLLLTVRSAGQTFRALFCIHAENGRVQLTELSYPNPAEPPMFCMLLRRRLVGSRILSVAQRGLDRALTIAFDARTDMGDPVELRLHVELMGKHSNLILEQDGVIVDCARHVSPLMSSVRTLQPGCAFTPAPRQEKRSLFDATDDALSAVLSTPDAAKRLCAAYEGLSRATAEMLLSSFPTVPALSAALAALQVGRLSPTVVSGATGTPAAVYPFATADIRNTSAYPTMAAAYDCYFAQRDLAVRIARHSASLRHTVETNLKRCENKLAVYQEALMGEAACEQYRRFGELLTANLYAVKRGQSVCIATDYSADPPAECPIPLDPLLTPNENAQRYFKRYKKSKAARAYAEQSIGAVTGEIAYLEGQLDNIGKCDALQELDEIRDELTALRYLRPQKRGMKAQKAAVTKPLRYVSGDGIAIYVGKNNRQNDLLTRGADGENLWLHVKDIPGSHVIVDCMGTPPEQTLKDAAMLAAWYSKARNSASVPVDYTLRKNVKKPAGAKPGMVIYTTNQTIYITPEESAVRALEPKA